MLIMLNKKELRATLNKPESLIVLNRMLQARFWILLGLAGFLASCAHLRTYQQVLAKPVHNFTTTNNAPLLGPEQDKNETLAGQLSADIKVLAATPRFSTADYARAVAYIRGQAQALGLKVTTEPVAVLPWQRGDSDEGHLVLPDGSTKPLRILALTGSAPSGSAGGAVEGEVILVPDFGRNQGPPPKRFDEGGKKRIVFFSRPLEGDSSIKEYDKTVVQRNSGAKWAAQYGAAAVLVRSVQTGTGPVHTGAVHYDPDPNVARIPAVALHVADADYLTQSLTSSHSPVSVRLKVAPKFVKRTQANVIIRIQGTTQPHEKVLISAHLDSHDTTPGAADDAAGVAAVLAVMRAFAKKPPARSLLLVLFADEELSGAGAQKFVKRHAKELPQIVAATEIDDGDGPPRALQITNPANSSTAAAQATLSQIAQRLGPDSANLPLSVDKEAYGTDLAQLCAKGVPEVAILQDLTHYFKKHHATSDTPENIDEKGLERTTLLLIQLTRVLASTELASTALRPE